MPKDNKSAAPKKGGEKEAKVEDKKPKVYILYKGICHVVSQTVFRVLKKSILRMVCLYSKALCRGADGLINGSFFWTFAIFFLNLRILRSTFFSRRQMNLLRRRLRVRREERSNLQYGGLQDYLDKKQGLLSLISCQNI